MRSPSLRTSPLGPGPAVVLLAVGIAALGFPWVAANPYVVHVANIGLIFAILAASWDLLYGYAGLLSFGHSGFFGVGAYTSALLSVWFGVSPWIGLFLGGVAAALFGALVGVPSLRLRGTYLALTTLAFAEVARIVVTNWQDVTRGTLGLSGQLPYPGIPLNRTAYYYLILGLACACVGFMYWLGARTRVGLVFRTIRSDEVRAQALGIDIVRFKILAFCTSAFFAGIAGAFYAHYVRVIAPGELGPTITVLTVAMATIGGIGTIVGPALAAVVIHVIYEQLRGVGVVYN
ncbi:MAG: branched-chain amino acid ABC transporter permease, partial [Planctomycetes bacterium]|nr:branched-chain amino acid ABC transporter permease [Planctomycetota bacterium]